MGRGRAAAKSRARRTAQQKEIKKIYREARSKAGNRLGSELRDQDCGQLAQCSSSPPVRSRGVFVERPGSSPMASSGTGVAAARLLGRP